MRFDAPTSPETSTSVGSAVKPYPSKDREDERPRQVHVGQEHHSETCVSSFCHPARRKAGTGRSDALEPQFALQKSLCAESKCPDLGLCPPGSPLSSPHRLRCCAGPLPRRAIESLRAPSRRHSRTVRPEPGSPGPAGCRVRLRNSGRGTCRTHRKTGQRSWSTGCEPTGSSSAVKCRAHGVLVRSCRAPVHAPSRTAYIQKVGSSVGCSHA